MSTELIILTVVLIVCGVCIRLVRKRHRDTNNYVVGHPSDYDTDFDAGDGGSDAGS